MITAFGDGARRAQGRIVPGVIGAWYARMVRGVARRDQARGVIVAL